jgi:hypothetical protein
MRYIARVMTMGDMSPAGLSHAYYNTPDGEPEDIVVEVLGYYDSLEELRDAAKEHGAYFDAEYGEDSGCWLEAEELDYD